MQGKEQNSTAMSSIKQNIKQGIKKPINRGIYTGWSLGVLVMVLAIMLAGCIGTSPAPPSPQKAPSPAPDQPEMRKVSMRLQWVPQYQFAGYIVAKVNGYYEEAGLEVDIHPGSPDFVPMPLVASGADTFGSTGADTIFLARKKDIKVVALLTIFQTSPVGFMVRADSGIREPRDFADKTVGVFYGDNVETEYRALLAATNVNRSDINEIPAQVNMEPFLSGRVDVWPVYVTDQPYLIRNQGIDIELIQAQNYGVTLMGDVLFATEEFVRAHPKTTRAFVSATLRGWHFALNNLEETVDLLLAYNPQLNREQLLFEGRETIKLVRAGAGNRCPGWNDPERWSTEQELLMELGLLPFPIAIEDAVETSFVAEYYQEHGITCSP
jgi:ABC-type nitrate/sulfonate/bicarbonate transport system substrate-binding protein